MAFASFNFTERFDVIYGAFFFCVFIVPIAVILGAAHAPGIWRKLIAFILGVMAACFTLFVADITLIQWLIIPKGNSSTWKLFIAGVSALLTGLAGNQAAYVFSKLWTNTKAPGS